MFIENDNPNAHINRTDNPFIKAYMKTVGRLAHLFWEHQLDYPEVFQEVFSRTTFSANIPEEVISLAAVQLEDGKVEGRKSKIFDYTGKN